MIWDKWNKDGGPRYPQEKVVQFVLRNYKGISENNFAALDF